VTEKQSDPYQALKEISREIRTFSSISHLLYWDRETYMPVGGSLPRSLQIAQLAGLIHELKTGKRLRTHLEKLVHLSTGRVLKKVPRLQRIILEEWADEFDRATKLPVAFVKQFSQLTSEASQIWSVARKTDDFALFAPYLEKIVAMNREKAAIFGFEDHPYDALLEGYEPCMTTKKIKVLFARLKQKLLALLEEIKAKQPSEHPSISGTFDVEKQMALGRKLLAALPMESHYSRLDLSVHPFSIAMHPHDSRMTTRITPDGCLSNLFSILHEAGHAMYEMGLPVEHWGTPLGETISLSIHESQSRWWETLIGRSRGFWEFFYPHVREMFSSFQQIPFDDFYRGMHKITSSFIRVEADEVTYSLHIILRFELEYALISGDLAVADLPHVWREKMRELLGIVPPTDREGCLQDIHWSLGEFGYFPTYALGNLFAAQFFEQFAQDHSDWEEQVQHGEFGFIRSWLTEHIHRYGKQYYADQLVKKITGKPLTETAYCTYLKNKYSNPS
jgi:carboxypeptidase Taq